jgi:hypothetical protein
VGHKRVFIFIVVAMFSAGVFFGVGCSGGASVAEQNKAAAMAVSLDKHSDDVGTQEMETQIDEHDRLYDEVERPADKPPVEDFQRQ